ncbi:RluA family pseudouridine synthase [Oenococcus alcoholitolerans]|uniref:Pseudouridine synthase n=1 Tax=Oenococcus alcoholitolerans TaxID=931074 RepID=A0ABR4XSI0_9LACO|nr:pseudouridylate synthase [Oenococcus alcoholitolerans]
MKFYQYKIKISDDLIGKSLKIILKKWLIPRYLRGLLRIDHRLTLNGEYVSVDQKAKKGDILSFYLYPEDFSGQQNYCPVSDHRLKIIYENEDFLVADKPAGMKMHPHSPEENDTLLNYIQAQMANKRSRGLTAKAFMVHRLDRQTSGAVIVAKNPLACSILNRFFAKKIISKIYLAWVSGSFSTNSGRISLPIKKDPLNPYRRIISKDDGLPAETDWTKIHTVYQNTLLRISLKNGRTHQIRVHLASIGHPLIGDDLYGGIDYPRLLLHSAAISFPALFSGCQRRISIAAQLPSDFPRQLRL